jgi:hypothetical protein
MATRTDAQLTTDANVIKNETAPGANTATRVGNMLVDAIDSKLNVDKIASPTVVGATKLYTDLAASNTDGAVSQAGIKTAVNLKANAAQDAWANLSYTAPWTTQNFAAKYRKSTLGEVALTGEVWTNGTTYTGSNGLIGTLPVGFRPAQQVRYSLNCFNASVRIIGVLSVNSDGTVVFDGATGTAISSVNLDVVRFYTD